MLYFLLPFFAFSLFTHLAWSALRILGLVLEGFSSFLATVVLAGSCTVLFIHSLSSGTTIPKRAYLTQASSATLRNLLISLTPTYGTDVEMLVLQYKNQLSATDRQTIYVETRQNQAIQKEITYWENLRQLQPTDRDVLVNLSTLYQSIGELQKSTEYLNQAKQVDPNHFN